MVDVVKKAQQAASNVGEAAGDVVEGAKEAKDEIVEGAKEVGEEVSEGDVEGAVEDAKDTAGEVGDTAGETSENVTSGKKDTGSSDPSEYGGEDLSKDVNEGGTAKDQKAKQTAEKVRDMLMPKSDKEQLEQAKEYAEKSGLADIENENRLEQEIESRRAFQPPGQREKAEAFVQNYQAEQTARQQSKKVEEQIQKVEEGPSRQELIEDLESRKKDLLDKSEETGKVYNLTPLNQKISELKSGKGIYKLKGPDGETETVSKDQALTKLKDQKSELSSIVSEARENQKSVLNPPERRSISIPGNFKEKGEVGPSFSSSPTDNPMTNQYGSGTNIPGGYSKGSPISNAGTRKSVKNSLELRGDAGTLAFTSTGFEAPFSVIDPDTTVQGIIEEDQRKAMERGNFGNAVEFLASPAGLVTTAGAGKLIGAGAKGIQASTSIGSGKIASGIGTAAKAGGAGLLGLQAGKGARNIAQGDLTKGGGQILQVTAETGALTKGLRSASKKYGRNLARTTTVEQDNVLRQIRKADDDTFMVGSGEMEARTRVLQDNPFKPRQADQVVDEVTSKANYRLVADEGGAEAQGTVTDVFPNGDETTKEFESLSNVYAKEGDTVVADGQRVELGEDEVATRNILRTKKEGRLFKNYEDTTTNSITRKEGEAPVEEVRAFNSRKIQEPLEVEDAMGRRNVVGELQADVLDQVRKGNLDGKTVRLSSYSNDRTGEVFSDTSNLVLNKRSGGSGPGSFSSGGGQGLKYRQDYGDGFVQESQRQVRAGEQFGARSREAAEEQLESGSQLQGFTTGGGSRGKGAQGDLGNQFQVQETQGPGETQTVENTGVQNLQVSRIRTGETLNTEIGSSVRTGSRLQTQGNRQRLRRRQTGENRSVQLNNVRTGLTRKTRPVQEVGQAQGRDLRNLNQLRQTTAPQVGEISQARLGTTAIPKIRSREKLGVTPGLKTSTVTTPATTTNSVGGAGLMKMDLEISGSPGSTKGEGNFGVPGGTKKDVNVSILSANRAELVTGKKTIDTDSVSSFSQSPFSGGLQTVQEQNLGKRQYKSDKEVDFY